MKRCQFSFEAAPKCWNGYSPYAHKRQTFERCDAHWHRPKRADWRAKAYQRHATQPCATQPFSPTLPRRESLAVCGGES